VANGSGAGNNSKKTGPEYEISPAQIRRRKEPRHSVDTGAVIRLLDIAAKVDGRILDVSMGGCRIRTSRPFPLGVFRRVETEFRIDGLPFRLAGVTQAIYDRFNVGIRFLDVSERMREQLAQLIGEIRELREREKGS
jgi:hypothetical protein